MHEKKQHKHSIIWYIFKRDLKRIVTNPVALAITLAILVFPSLYAWCGIGANWDPYSLTGNMKIAVVNEDVPATLEVAGKSVEVNVGAKIEEQLQNNDKIGWVFCDRETALENVDVGVYYGAIILPEDFSSNFVNVFKGKDSRDFVHFDYYVNERENPISVKVADTGASTIETQINQNFNSVVGSAVGSILNELSSNAIDNATDVSKTLAERISSISNTLGGFKETIDYGGVTLDNLNNTLSETQHTISDIQNTNTQLKSSLNQTSQICTNMREKIYKLIKELEDSGLELELLIDILKSLSQSMDDIITATADLQTLISDVDALLGKVSIMINDLSKVNNSLLNSTDGIKKTIDNICLQLDASAITMNTLGDRGTSMLSKILTSDSSYIGSFMSSPVKIEKTTINPVDNYGTGVAPFFSCISFWFGGFILIALFKTEVEPPRRRKTLNAKQAYISRGLLYSLIAIIQGFVCCIGDLIIGIQCEQPVMFVLTGMISAFVFVNIIYMLAACFKHVGKAFAVVLVIMQIPGSSGMFPIELMPLPFKLIHPFLPFTHAIAALRETIVAFDVVTWGLAIFVLAIFWAISMLLGVYLRKSLVSLNNLFDRKLSQTGMIECEEANHLATQPGAIENVVSALAHSQEYSDTIDSTISKIDNKFSVKKWAVILLATVPFLFLIVLSIVFYFVEVSIDAKVFLMFIWLLILLLLSINVIAMEFIHTDIKKKVSESVEEVKAHNLAENASKQRGMGQNA